MKNVKWSLVASAVGLTVSLAGCGGGGGGKSLYGDGTDGNNGVSGVSSEKATQRSVSFSAEKYNLDWSFDGSKASVTIRIADTAGNPLPKGTKVQFSVSGGQIVKTCTTGSAGDAGATGCSVEFSTANPRPANGIVSVVAWLIGEESYKDLNGNGKYDSGEPFYESGTLFRDDDADEAYSAADELVVGTTLDEGKVGVGTSACREDAAAKPSEVPLSVPNTCDGVWGKTLVRAQKYFAVSDPRDMGLEQGLTSGGSSLNKAVRVFSWSPDHNSKVAAPAGTVLTVEGLASGCTASFTPSNTVSDTDYLPTQHTIVFTGGAACPSSGTVSVKATFGSNTQFANIAI